MRKLPFLLLICCLFFANAAFSQKTITGTVTDENSGDPLIGVNVVVKEDLGKGTVTDFNGKYTLTVGDDATALVFKFIGYQSIEIPISGNTIDAKLKEDVVELGAAVVTASKRKEKILDAPASISLITQKQIKNTVGINATDYLKSTQGVDIMKTGLGSENVVVRGFNNIFSGGLLTIVDNRIARVPSLRVNVSSFIPTSSDDYERIEVLRGPASALYGPNSSDGVVHIITKSPIDQDEKFETTVNIGGGFRSKIDDTIHIKNTADPVYDYDSFSDRALYFGSVRHSARLNEKIGYKVTASYFAGTDWRYDDPAEPDSIILGRQTADGRVTQGDTIPNVRDESIEKIAVDGRLDYRFNDKGEIIFSGGMSQNTLIEMTGIGTGQTDGWRYSYAQMRFRYDDLFAQVFANFSNSGDTYLFRSGDLIVDRSKVFVTQVQHASSFAKDKVNLVYGVDAIFTRPDTDNTINGRNEDDDEITEIGGYIQGTYDPHEKISLVAGTRYDYHNFIDDGFWSPRGAIVFKPTKKHTLRATYNRAFGSPSSNNLNLDINQAPDAFGLGAALGNPALFGTDVRAVGNRGGYTYSRDPNDYPQFRTPFASLAGLGTDPNAYYTLGEEQGLNNFIWVLTRGAVQAGINDQLIGLGDEVDSLLIPENLAGAIDNVLKVLNLTTLDFEDADKTKISDYGGIDNTVTQTYEIGYKGGLFNKEGSKLKDKVFLTADFYRTDIKNFVSPLTNITPNVFLDEAQLYAQIEPIIRANYDAQDANFQGLLTAVFDLSQGNGDGDPVPEIAGLYASSAAGVPMGTVSPLESGDGSAIYVTYVNIGDVTLYGFDLGLTVYPTNDLRISTGYSFVNKDSIPVEGAQLGYVGLNAPRHKFGIRGDYNIKFGSKEDEKHSLNVGLGFRWQDDFPANSGSFIGRVDEIHNMDLNLSYVPGFSKETRISLSIQNLYNNEQQYFPGAPVIGMTTILKLSHTF